VWTFVAIALLVVYGVVGINGATTEWTKRRTRVSPVAILVWLVTAIFWLPTFIYSAASLPKDK
jgi:hypothetical protein